MGEEHPEFNGWYFSGQYTHEGRALWMRPRSAFERWLRILGWIVLWGVGVLVVMGVCFWLVGGVVPQLMEPR